MFVEARLVASDGILVGGPEAGGVGGEGFIDEDGFGAVGDIGVDAEFELGVGENDAAGEGVLGGVGIEGNGEGAGFGHDFGADGFSGIVEGDRHIVTGVGFGGGGEEGFGELLALLEAGREFEAADGAGLLVVFPARAGDVAADDELDG